MKHFLIVVDMQKDFIDGALGNPETAAVAPRVAERIRGFEGDIIATLDTHFDNYLETAEGRKLPVEHCLRATPGWEFDAQVAAALEGRDVTRVEKLTFGSVDLPEVIRRAADGEEFDIELTGVCTDICVVSNALLLKANFPEAPIAVRADCCAGVTPASHEAALTTMRFCQIDII